MEENKIDELMEEAKDDLMTDATNTTWNEDAADEPVESNEPEQFEQTEGDLAPANEPKEEWREDIAQNETAHASDAAEQVEGGAFAQARSSWANGWTV